MDSAPTPTFQLSLLGRFELSGPEGPIDLTSKKLAGLLAFLACTASQAHSRDKLMALLWGSHFEAQARQNLRQALSRLRRILGEGTLVTNGETVSLRPGTLVCDVAQFETLLSRRYPRCPACRGRPLQGLSADRHRYPGRGLDRMVGRPAAAAGGPGARCHGKARGAGVPFGPSRAGAQGRQPGNRGQQSARGRASAGHARAGRRRAPS